MRFDNQQFERNVQTSLSTLDKLKQGLDLDGAAKGLAVGISIELVQLLVDLIQAFTSAGHDGLNRPHLQLILIKAGRNRLNSERGDHPLSRIECGIGSPSFSSMDMAPGLAAGYREEITSTLLSSLFLTKLRMTHGRRLNGYEQDSR